jgi:hypothetical protein
MLHHHHQQQQQDIKKKKKKKKTNNTKLFLTHQHWPLRSSQSDLVGPTRVVAPAG